jgi:hypothetical protein
MQTQLVNSVVLGIAAVAVHRLPAPEYNANSGLMARNERDIST